MQGTDEIADFERLAQSIRPKLHRYCARMAGSSIDGEDIVQDALLKAMQSGIGSASIANPEAWLFRIAHNTAIDFLRRRMRLRSISIEQSSEVAIADQDNDVARREIAAMGLRTFMKLSPAERSCVILMDIFGYSVREVGQIIDSTEAAVKAALHRGRTRLASLARDGEADKESTLSARDSDRLANYVDRFNARDFDAVRDLLADDVHLDLVNRMTLRGKTEVGRYFGNYASRNDWLLSVGSVEGRAAVLSRNALDEAGPPTNFILLDWQGEAIVRIRDFYHCPHVLGHAVSAG